MKVVLKKNVENVGKAGEIKEVADGFARNFLMPNGLAEPATKSNISKAEQDIKQQKQQQQEELEVIQKKAEKIDGMELVFEAKTEGNKLFGSIGQKEIADKLTEEGNKVAESLIILDQPIKEIGEYQAKINFNHGIEANIKVIVEKEK